MSKSLTIVIGSLTAVGVAAIICGTIIATQPKAAPAPTTIVTSEPQPAATVTVSPEPAPTVTVTATPAPVSIPTYDECMYTNPVPQYCIDNYEAYNG